VSLEILNLEHTRPQTAKLLASFSFRFRYFQSAGTEALILALNETTDRLRFAESAARHFTSDTKELEAGSPAAVSVAFISNSLSDAQESLIAAQGEIGKLIQQSQNR